MGDLHPGPRRPSPPLVVAPSPVLLPIYSNPSHLPPPVHKNLPSEVGNIDPLRDLPVQAVGMDPSHSHIISDISSVVVVIRVQLQHRLVLVLDQLVGQVLASPSIVRRPPVQTVGLR